MWQIENENIWQLIINQADQMEFDWAGIDSNEFPAIFSTFNTGYTPKCVTTSLALYNELVTFIDDLENTSAAIRVTTVKADHSDWKKFANKGLFGYDNENVHTIKKPDRYHLIYKPKKPIQAKELSGLEKYKSIIPVFNLAFSEFVTFDEMRTSLKTDIL